MALRDCIYGLAVGDAFGVPYEFMGRDTFTPSRDMVGGGAHNQSKGTFSDDTSMTLATCASIKAKRKRIDTADMQKRFIAWMRKGDYAIDRVVFDIGTTVSTALVEGTGCKSERSNGNGSLMRIAPLAYTKAKDEEIEAASAITHAHALSCKLCVKYVHLLHEIEAGADGKSLIAKREPEIASKQRDDIGSSGYVKDTYEASLWCILNTDCYEDAVWEAVNLGRDTDTTAAVTGALAGAIYGYAAIPEQWLSDLRGKDLIESVLF